MPPVTTKTTTTAVAKKTVDMPIQSVADLTTIGSAFAASGMFGIKNAGAGVVLAMTCIQQKITPLEFIQTYHIIEGKPSMRADAMLADFCSKYDGEFTIQERSAERVAIELKRGDKTFPAAFTWKEAQEENYCYCKDSKKLKDNWSTPRRRMQMMWARLISDSIRAFCPQVVKGTYTPEEIEEFSDSRQEKAVEVPASLADVQTRMNQSTGIATEPEATVIDAEVVQEPEATEQSADIDYTRCPDVPNMPASLRGLPWAGMKEAVLQNALSAIMSGKYAELTPPYGEVIQNILNGYAEAKVRGANGGHLPEEQN